jgi:glycosyltransferase involved in cell wall biosynthesis
MDAAVNMADTPKVSVILPVYNGEPHLKSAIKSILDQTLENFELIIIDDGSKDDSLKTMKSFDDPRIQIVSRPNKGLPATLNEGIALAKGAYIARQDQDDLSMPDRLATEVAFLDARPEVGLVGSNYIIMDESGKPQETTRVFTHPDDLKVAEWISNQFGHGSVMMRKDVVDKVGGYDTTVGIVEDYDLFTRLAKATRIANIRRPLYKWRRTPTGMSLSNVEEQAARAFNIRDREFEYFRKHRSEYKLLTSFHPFTFGPNVLRYFLKKSALFRDLGYLYLNLAHDRQQATKMLIAAIIYAPWRKSSYKHLYYLLSGKDLSQRWRFDYL